MENLGVRPLEVLPLHENRQKAFSEQRSRVAPVKAFFQIATGRKTKKLL